MKLGIIADTHIPVRSGSLPPEIYELFKGVERILHAGDVEEQKVLDDLEAIAPVTAVAGNMDSRLRGLPYKREIRIGDRYVGVIHGSGVPRNLIREAIRREFKWASIIVYGHTHQAFWGEEGGVWFMNPGSPTDTVFAPYRSVGMLELGAGIPRGEIIQL